MVVKKKDGTAGFAVDGRSRITLEQNLLKPSTPLVIIVLQALSSAVLLCAVCCVLCCVAYGTVTRRTAYTHTCRLSIVGR